MKLSTQTFKLPNIKDNPELCRNQKGSVIYKIEHIKSGKTIRKIFNNQLFFRVLQIKNRRKVG